MCNQVGTTRYPKLFVRRCGAVCGGAHKVHGVTFRVSLVRLLRALSVNVRWLLCVVVCFLCEWVLALNVFGLWWSVRHRAPTKGRLFVAPPPRQSWCTDEATQGPFSQRPLCCALCTSPQPVSVAHDMLLTTGLSHNIRAPFVVLHNLLSQGRAADIV